MNLSHLKYLLAVEKYKSISKAAQHLYINQPHLSKIIKDLEERVNIKIFERDNKGVVPTEKGRQFLLQAKKIVEEVDYLENMYQDDSEKIYLDICVPRASYISKAFTDFLSDADIIHKDINVNYRETNTLDAISRIYDGDNNIGIIRVPEREQEYFMHLLKLKNMDHEEIFSFEYVLLMSRLNPLVNKDIYMKDLQDQLELIHGDISIPEARDLKTDPKEIQIYERSIQFELLMNVKDCYMWVSPMPPATLDRFELVTKKCLDKKMKYVDYFIYRKGYTLTSDDSKFIDYVKETIKNTL